jgi:23S rRNA pseudoU1915 N3-methylase RlmH
MFLPPRLPLIHNERTKLLRFWRKLTDRDLLILLDDKGRQFSSEEFAVQLNKLFNSGKSKIVMVNRRLHMALLRAFGKELS